MHRYVPSGSYVLVRRLGRSRRTVTAVAFHEPVSNDSYSNLVHQAAGMVSEQCDCSIDLAFARIAQFAGNRGQSVDDVSAQIINRDLRFDGLGFVASIRWLGRGPEGRPCVGRLRGALDASQREGTTRVHLRSPRTRTCRGHKAVRPVPQVLSR